MTGTVSGTTPSQPLPPAQRLHNSCATPNRLVGLTRSQIRSSGRTGTRSRSGRQGRLTAATVLAYPCWSRSVKGGVVAAGALAGARGALPGRVSGGHLGGQLDPAEGLVV